MTKDDLIAGSGGGGGGGGSSSPDEAKDNLESSAYALVVDLLGEGEIEGFATPSKAGLTRGTTEYDTAALKDIYLENTPILRGSTDVRSATYSQTTDTITVTLNSHGFSVGYSVQLIVQTGGAQSGVLKITTATANTFSAAATNDATTSGTAVALAVGGLNYKNTAIYLRFGTGGQSRIPFGGNISEEIGVGLTVEKDTPVTRTITDTNVDQVRVTISVPQLQRIQDDGDIVGSEFDLRIQVQYNGGGFYTVHEDTVKGRTADQYQRDYLVDLRSQNPNNFPVDIRVVRVSEDSSSAKTSNSFIWASYTEIIQAKLNYPHSALVGLRVNAEQFRSVPSRAYRVRGLKVKIPSNATVSNSNGRLVYSGTWDGTFQAAQWTSDPAWCLWDLLTSKRYGFGTHIDSAQLDKWAFYSASQYCSALVPNGFGGTEPRFSCNAILQSPTEAYKLINDLCSVFRAMPYWGSGALTISQDRPVDPSYLFTMANVAEEGFSYSGSDIKARPNVVVVQYLDLNSRDAAYEQVEDRQAIERYGIIKQEIVAFACTSRGQAARIGEWMLYAAQYETEVVSFTASIEAGVVVRPGQVIEIADPVRAGVRRGGRLVAATATVLTVDSSEGLPSSGTVSVVLPDGTIETKSATRSGVTITLSSALSKTPNVGSVWVFRNGGGIQTSYWRVLTVSEEDGSQYAVTALSYNASKYNYIERDRPLQPRDVTNLTEPVDPPTNLKLSETLYKYQDQVRAKVVINWRPRTGVNEYLVRWRKSAGNWNRHTTQSPDHEILNITPGKFEIEIYSIDSLGRPSSSSLEGTIDALGKAAPPGNVTGFSVVLDPDIGATLTWNPVGDLDLQGYEIWQGGSFGTGIKVGVFAATAKKVGLMPTGTTTWHIKALDTSGVYSASAASVSLTIAAATPPVVGGRFAGENFVITWTKTTGDLATDSYEIRYGSIDSTWDTATVLTTSKSTAYSTKASWIGTRRFFVAAIDVKGNTSLAGTVDAIVTAPGKPTITQQVIDNNVLLRWNDVTQTLPITSYELRRGATWASATVIGTKQGGFTTVFETASGVYTYWLAGIDAAGNYGTPGSVAATVNQPPDYVLQLNQESQWTENKTNIYSELPSSQVVNVDTTETWQSHFADRGWTTPQQQINAGYPYYAMPTTSTAAYEEEFDYGTILSGTKVSATLTNTSVTGSTTVTPTLRVRGTTSTSATYSRTSATITVTSTAHGLVVGDYVYLDFTSGTATDDTYVVATASANSFTVTSTTSGTTSGNVSWIKWISYPGLSEVYATQFRYFRVRYDFASSGGNDLMLLTELNVRLSAKRITDSGNGTANSADSGGTTVDFNIPFIDVKSISVTPSGTTPRIAIYNFVDTANPTSFKVLLFDTSGNRASGSFSWQARGV